MIHNKQHVSPNPSILQRLTVSEKIVAKGRNYSSVLIYDEKY